MVSLCAPTVITTKASTFAISHQLEMLQTADRWDAFFDKEVVPLQRSYAKANHGNAAASTPDKKQKFTPSNEPDQEKAGSVRKKRTRNNNNASAGAQVMVVDSI